MFSRILSRILTRLVMAHHVLGGESAMVGAGERLWIQNTHFVAHGSAPCITITWGKNGSPEGV